MNKLLLTPFLLFTFFYLHAQSFTGQWKGSFVDNSSIISWGSSQCEYVLELEAKGKTITGYSYTYFNEDGKKYYTICTVEGTLNTKTKYVEIVETARTKTNVPVSVTNSFQKHILRWHREAGKEVLEGNWTPAPGQNNGSTGYGNTLLSKRVLTEIYPLAKNKAKVTTPFNSPKKITKPGLQNSLANNKIKNNTTLPPKITTNKAPIAVKKSPVTPLQKKPLTLAKKETPLLPPPLDITTIDTKKKILPLGFETRNSTVLQTVEVENSIVKIELYDNGDVDGDSVSLIFNDELILTHKKLTTAPIKIDLPIKDGVVNELKMYADNLGLIPPNTALMIVMDGNKRYEVRITSDLKRTGTIRFVHKKDG